MEIQFEERDGKGSFYMERDGQRLAIMTFRRKGSNLISIDHTEVSDLLRGAGAGKKLLIAYVDWARKEGLKIIPLCPYAKSVFEKTPEYADVVAE